MAKYTWVPFLRSTAIPTFLEVTNIIDYYQQGTAFNVHLHSCEVAKGGVSLRTSYALMQRSFEYMGPNSSFAGKYFALVPNFILSTIPGNRELLVKCFFHKHVPRTCIRCLKQAVQQGENAFECPNVSCPSNVSENASLRPGGVWGSRLEDWMQPVGTASTRKTMTSPNAISTENTASTTDTGDATDLPSATGTGNPAGVIGDRSTKIQENLEQVSVQSGAPEQYNQVTKEPPHANANLQNPGKRTSTFGPLGPSSTKTQNRDKQDKQTQTKMDYLRPKGKLIGVICSEVEMWMSSRPTIVNCGPIQDTKVVDDLYERLVIQESLTTQLSKDTEKLVGTIGAELPNQVINERLDSLETANTELFKNKEQFPDIRQQFTTIKEEMDKKADKSELGNVAKKDKIAKRLGDLSSDSKRDQQRVTQISNELTKLASIVQDVRDRMDQYNNKGKLLTETPTTPEKQSSTQPTAAQQKTILATQQKVVQKCNSTTVQQTTSSSSMQMPVTGKVDVPTDGARSSPASQTMTMSTPDVPPLPMDSDTPSTISVGSTPPRSNTSTPPLLPPNSTHPSELASTEGPPTTDPQSVSDNSMGAPSNPKKKRTERDDTPRRRQAHQRHSSL